MHIYVLLCFSSCHSFILFNLLSVSEISFPFSVSLASPVFLPLTTLHFLLVEIAIPLTRPLVFFSSFSILPDFTLFVFSLLHVLILVPRFSLSFGLALLYSWPPSFPFLLTHRYVRFPFHFKIAIVRTALNHIISRLHLSPLSTKKGA